MTKVLKSIDKRKKFEIFKKNRYKDFFVYNTLIKVMISTDKRGNCKKFKMNRYKHFFWVQHLDQGYQINW